MQKSQLLEQKNGVFFKDLGAKKKKKRLRGTWLAQPVEHATLDLGVVSLSLTLGTERT